MCVCQTVNKLVITRRAIGGSCHSCFTPTLLRTNRAVCGIEAACANLTNWRYFRNKYHWRRQKCFFFFLPRFKAMCICALSSSGKSYILWLFFCFVFLTLIEHFQSIFSPKWDSKASLIPIFKSADGSWEQPLKLVVIIWLCVTPCTCRSKAAPQPSRQSLSCGWGFSVPVCSLIMTALLAWENIKMKSSAPALSSWKDSHFF